jgi:hypothetical protein
MTLTPLQEQAFMHLWCIASQRAKWRNMALEREAYQPYEIGVGAGCDKMLDPPDLLEWRRMRSLQSLGLLWIVKPDPRWPAQYEPYVRLTREGCELAERIESDAKA